MIDPDFGLDLDDGFKDEKKYKVRDVLKNAGDKILYEYDFGDNWQHLITLEKILPFDKDQFLPVCIKGKRGCPPEDVGGPWGYADFLERWNNEDDPEYQELREWVEDDFEPEICDLFEINANLIEDF